MTDLREPEVGDVFVHENTGVEVVIHARTNSRNVWYVIPGTTGCRPSVTWRPRANFLRFFKFVRKGEGNE